MPNTLKKSTQRKKVIKAWAVVWSKHGSQTFGIPTNTIIPVEPMEEIKVELSKIKRGRPKFRFAEPFAIFKEKYEAEAYKRNNPDFKIIPITITYNISK